MSYDSWDEGPNCYMPEPVECRECDGAGRIFIDTDEHHDVAYPCRKCDGEGMVTQEPEDDECEVVS